MQSNGLCERHWCPCAVRPLGINKDELTRVWEMRAVRAGRFPDSVELFSAELTQTPCVPFQVDHWVS